MQAARCVHAGTALSTPLACCNACSTGCGALATAFGHAFTVHRMRSCPRHGACPLPGSLPLFICACGRCLLQRQAMRCRSVACDAMHFDCNARIIVRGPHLPVSCSSNADHPTRQSRRCLTCCAAISPGSGGWLAEDQPVFGLNLQV